jgi:hypothetical protein
MKCKKCGNKASVNMRQHKLALCKEHYLEWVPEQTERFIKKYGMFTHEERILVAVSGGKDSLALWDILIVSAIRRMGCTSGWGSMAASIIRTSPSAWRRSSLTGTDSNSTWWTSNRNTDNPSLCFRRSPTEDTASRAPCADWRNATR